MNQDNQKLELEYPCKWTFKVIGTNRERIEKAIAGCVPHEENRRVSFSNISRGGKYCSLNLEVTVTDEKTRTAIYIALKKHPDVKIVM